MFGGKGLQCGAPKVRCHPSTSLRFTEVRWDVLATQASQRCTCACGRVFEDRQKSAFSRFLSSNEVFDGFSRVFFGLPVNNVARRQARRAQRRKCFAQRAIDLYFADFLSWE